MPDGKGLEWCRSEIGTEISGAAQGTTTNGLGLLPFKSGAFLAGAPVQPVILQYGPDRVSPAWESVGALWHAALLLANLTHSVHARQVCNPPEPYVHMHADRTEVSASCFSPVAHCCA